MSFFASGINIYCLSKDKYCSHSLGKQFYALSEAVEDSTVGYEVLSF